MEDLASLQTHLTNVMLFGFGIVFAAISGIIAFLTWLIFHFNKKIDSVVERLEKSMEDMADKHDEAMKDMAGKHNEAMKDMAGKHNEAMKDMADKHDEAMNSMTDNNNKRFDMIETELGALNRKVNKIDNNVSWIQGVLYEREKHTGQLPYQLAPDRTQQEEAAEVSEPPPENTEKS